MRVPVRCRRADRARPLSPGRPLRLVFLGTPTPAVVALRALVGAGHDIALVVTRADVRRGRGGSIAYSPVKEAALQLGLAVSDRVADVVDSGAELGIVVAYGRLVRPEVLRQVPMVNVHFSLLPRWRGAAPVERAILAGDAETGVCLMGLEEGLDTGPVYRRLVVPIGESDSADMLRDRLAVLGAGLLVSGLDEGLGEPTAQVGEATYAAKLDPSELRLDWSSPADELLRVVRVGRAWTTWRGQRLLILGAGVTAAPPGPPGVVAGGGEAVVSTGAGGLRLDLVQPEGRRATAGADWLRGARPIPGEALD